LIFSINLPLLTRDLTQPRSFFVADGINRVHLLIHPSRLPFSPSTGLRAIKSVLVVAGTLKRADPDLPEEEVLMRALRDFNIPKIITEDMEVFMGLIGDLFPKKNPLRKVDPALEQAVRKVWFGRSRKRGVSGLGLMEGGERETLTAARISRSSIASRRFVQVTKESRLQAEDKFVLKVIQLQELLAVRHSVFIIGPPGSGKSRVRPGMIPVLARQLLLLRGSRVVAHVQKGHFSGYKCPHHSLPLWCRCGACWPRRTRSWGSRP